LVEKARLQAAVTQLRARQEEFINGQGFIFNLVDSQNTWASAISDYQNAVVTYNIALADFQRQMGTLPRYDNGHIAEGPLPRFVRERASEHIRERSVALELRERERLTPPTEPPPLHPPEAVPIPQLVDELKQGTPLPGELKAPEPSR